jgi:flagellar motor switch protein FliN/FliY
MTDQHGLDEAVGNAQNMTGVGGNLSAVVLGALGDMQLALEVRVGSAHMSLRELTECSPGTVLTLDSAVGGLADLLIGGHLVARGELVAIDDQLGLRIVEIVTAEGSDEK